MIQEGFECPELAQPGVAPLAHGGGRWR
jgi:hypothetical protein